MKVICVPIVFACSLFLASCSKHAQPYEQSLISFKSTNDIESQFFKKSLSDFANTNGFTNLVYADSDKSHTGSLADYDYEYEQYRPKAPNFIDIKRWEGCLTVTTLVHDGDQEEFKDLMKKLNDLLRKNIQDHRTIYVNTECGAKLSTAIE